MDDIDKYRSYMVTGSEEIDYLDISDENLINMDIQKLHRITDLAALDRIAKLDKSKLSDKQLTALEAEYHTKYIIDKSDVSDLLSKIKECEDVYSMKRTKNGFRQMYGITAKDCLKIVHSLTLGDYVCSTKSKNPNYLGNDMVVFIPKGTFKLANGNILENFKIYIKIDLSESTLDDDGSTVVIVSFHDDETEITV
jgi:hypothetical protein